MHSLELPTQTEITDIIATGNPTVMKEMEGIILVKINRIRHQMKQIGIDIKPLQRLEEYLSKSLGLLMKERQRIEVILSNHS